jgi:hydrogenase maturation protease
MRIIIGYGNDLRGEDAFGVDVIKLLKKHHLKDTILIDLYQLTPELCLELQDAKEIIFIDAGYSQKDQYSLACNLQGEGETKLSHHISPKVIISLLNNVYKKYPKYEIYSMLTDEFDMIADEKMYSVCVEKIKEELVKKYKM